MSDSESDEEEIAAQAEDLDQYERKLHAQSAVVTEHSVEIGGQQERPPTPAPCRAPVALTAAGGPQVEYTATAGTQPVWNADGKVIASLFYTFYQRTDLDADPASRPLCLSFNGGPGSASLWMHIAYTGPVQLNIDEEGYPLQPCAPRSAPCGAAAGPAPPRPAPLSLLLSLPAPPAAEPAAAAKTA